jgi:proteasome lid subunit RPN8/RPN11
MLTLPSNLTEQIEQHGIDSYPYEGCGLLLGQHSATGNVVVAIRPMQNVWPVEAEKPERFRIDEQAWLSAELDAMQHDLDIVGIFHSHPDHPAVASPRDLAWASWPGYSYLITEIRGDKALANRSWQLSDDRSGFYEEEVAVVNTAISH